MTLTEFLEARIAEDEEVARGAVDEQQGGHWHEPGDDMPMFGFSVALPLTFAEHAARHDPARVLAECEAKRRIVASVERALRLGTNGLGPSVLRLLALPHADHADYDESWRP